MAQGFWKALPKYRKHRASGQAIVTLGGRDFYLGPHGTKSSKLEYDRLVAEWLGRGRVIQPDECGATVAQVIVAYVKHAKRYYRKSGKETREAGCIVDAMRFVRRLYGKKSADEFGPMALQVVREEMIKVGWSRKYINKQVGRIVRGFKWAASQEIIDARVAHGLATVTGLHRGRTEAPDHGRIEPVPENDYQQTLAHLPLTVADLVKVQRLMGGRPQDVCNLRPCDINRAGDIWLYRPHQHKTEHHGRERVIAIGPKAQKILAPYLLRGADEFCFSPADTTRKTREARRAVRKTPESCGNRPGTNRKQTPKRQPGKQYKTDTYRRAIHRACDKAKVKRWSPNRLRHSAATEIRSRFGLEASQVILGHASVAVTQVYAERDLALATRVARECG